MKAWPVALVAVMSSVSRDYHCTCYKVLRTTLPSTIARTATQAQQGLDAEILTMSFPHLSARQYPEITHFPPPSYCCLHGHAHDHPPLVQP